MKNRITSILAIVLMMLATSTAFAGGTKSVDIKTSAVCGECKERIETALFKVDGVKSAKLDLKTETIKVKYNEDKTNEMAIRNAVAAAGYDADNVKADPTAHNKLPACCKIDSEKKK